MILPIDIAFRQSRVRPDMTHHGIGCGLDHIHEGYGPFGGKGIVEISSSATYSKCADGGDIGLHYLN